jgi:hypothetical protein
LRIEKMGVDIDCPHLTSLPHQSLIGEVLIMGQFIQTL